MGSDSQFNLTGKVALVTGGNGGIGLGMADSLARAGADVCIWGRNEKKNEAAREKLASHGGRVLAMVCDVSDEAQVETCFSETVATLGRVDSCFANAGVSATMVPFHETTLDEWRKVTRVNLDGVFLTFRTAVRHMIEREGGGVLVATSSLSAIDGMARGESYAASKAGLLAMVRGLSVEYARYGIRANSIVPGWIETDMTGPLFGWDKFEKAVMPRLPMRRWGQPEDFGAAAVYFASDASSYHTGDMVVIDGAYSRF